MLRSRPSVRSRRRALPLLASAGVLVFLAASCKQDNTPLYYDNPPGVIQSNFITGCEGGSTNTTLLSSGTCSCMFSVVEQHIPASSEDLKKNPDKYKGYSGKTLNQIESEIKNDPSKIPPSLNALWVQSCGDQGYGGTTTSTTSSGGGLVTTTTAK